MFNTRCSGLYMVVAFAVTAFTVLVVFGPASDSGHDATIKSIDDTPAPACPPGCCPKMPPAGLLPANEMAPPVPPLTTQEFKGNAAYETWALSDTCKLTIYAPGSCKCLDQPKYIELANALDEVYMLTLKHHKKHLETKQEE